MKKAHWVTKQCFLKTIIEEEGLWNCTTVQPTKLLPVLLKEHFITSKALVSYKKWHKYSFAKMEDMLTTYHANTFSHPNSITRIHRKKLKTALYIRSSFLLRQ